MKDTPDSLAKIDSVSKSAVPSHFFTGQMQHLLLLAALLPGAWWLSEPVLDGNRWLGIEDRVWFLLCLAVPVTQQILAWLVFRGQLSFQALTRWFGRADMMVWGAVFMPLLIARPLLLAGLAAADAGSLALPVPLAWLAGLLLSLPAFYTLWSVHRYFGVARALGGDHFRERFREMPFVRQGAYRWNGNAMYAFAFLLLWAIAIIGRSGAALAVALFQHAYVWVHWYCTEQPDIQILYAGENS